MTDFEILDQEQREKLTQEKMEARKRLLAMSPLQAQEKVILSLHCDQWSVPPENLTWEESILIVDDSTDS